MLYIINVYFSEFNLAVEVDEKGQTDRDLIFEKRDKKHKFDSKFIMINTSKENHDADCEIGRIKIYISVFKNKKLR